MKAILTEKLTRKFNVLTALDEVDLEVEKGESFGLLGPNGAGKTTLISILSTLLRPTSGRAMISGLDVVSQEAKVRKRIGIVFQDPSLDERLSATENLDLHASLYAIPIRERAERIRWALDFMELSQRQHDFVRTYSGGMRRRLEIARCILHNPEILFLDEPTVGLDPQTRDHIWTYLERLCADQGVTIVLTTHYMEEADRLCSRVAIIDHGRIVAVAPPEQLKKNLGNSILTLSTDKPVELLDVLGLSPQERAGASILKDRITLSVADPEAVLSLAFRVGEAGGIRVSSVSISKPTLNDVFLKLTGRDIREEKAEKNSFAMRVWARK